MEFEVERMTKYWRTIRLSLWPLFRPVLALLLAVITGCSGEPSAPDAERRSAGSKLKIEIEADQAAFKPGQSITIIITITNLTAKELAAPETYWSASVLLDGKEYKRLGEHVGTWNGPGVILPNGCHFRTSLTLSEYGIGPDDLTPGTHEVAVEIEDDRSNSVTITIE